MVTSENYPATLRETKTLPETGWRTGRAPKRSERVDLGFREMSSFEHLRYLAQASHVPARYLVEDAAMAMSGFAHDSGSMLIASRRILSQHPECGPLWWMCARLLTAPDVHAEAERILDDIDADRTTAELAAALPPGAHVLVVGWPESTAEALAARTDVTVWLGENAWPAQRELDAVGLETRRWFGREFLTSDGGAGEVASGSGGGSFSAELGPPGGVFDAVLVDCLLTGPRAALTQMGVGAALRDAVPALDRRPAASDASARASVWFVAGTGRRLTEPLFRRAVEQIEGFRSLTLESVTVPAGSRVLCEVGLVRTPIGVSPGVVDVPELVAPSV